MAATMTEAIESVESVEMDTDFLVEIVKNTTSEVFSTMLMMEVEPRSVRRVPPGPNGAVSASQAGPEVVDGMVDGMVDGVVGIIGIAGSWVGTGIIMCTPELACKASSAMMMSEYDAVNGEVLDAMGEITNMIIGNVKTALEERYGAMGISVPTVVYGRNFATRTVSRGEWFIVGFAAGGSQLEIHLNLAQNPRSNDKVTPGFVRTEAVIA